MSQPRSLAEVLASVSDVLIPADGGDACVSIDSRASDDETPLHVLTWRDDTDGAELVIAAGADVNAVGDMGETPLHVAAHKQNRKLIRLLLQTGADPSIRSEFDKTARDVAGPALADLFDIPATTQTI